MTCLWRVVLVAVLCNCSVMAGKSQHPLGISVPAAVPLTVALLQRLQQPQQLWSSGAAVWQAAEHITEIIDAIREWDTFQFNERVLDAVDLFAGRSRITLAYAERDLTCVAYDIHMGGVMHDFLVHQGWSSSGAWRSAYVRATLQQFCVPQFQRTLQDGHMALGRPHGLASEDVKHFGQQFGGSVHLGTLQGRLGLA